MAECTLRNCIPLSVIAGLLAHQLVAIPHAHAGISAAEQQKHDTIPHIHCSFLGHSHHGHGHSSHGDRHDHDCPAGPAATSHNEVRVAGLDGVAHDATAIYCAGDLHAVFVHHPQVPISSQLGSHAALSICQPLCELDLSDGALERARPPDKVLDGSNSYLTLRNLRI